VGETPITRIVQRSIALFVLVLALVLTWSHAKRVPVVRDTTLVFAPEPLPPEPVLAAHLGPFHMERAWELTLGWAQFGGYSALVPLPDGRLLAISDYGKYLAFTPPDAPIRATPRYGTLIPTPHGDKRVVDVESATRDPATGRIWLGLEFLNAVVRLGPDLTEQARVRPEAIAGWAENTGTEAMARLHDGRFVLLSEGPRQWWRPSLHEAVIFPGDPVARPEAAQRFTFNGPSGFDPVDMAQLPDGRVLVLMRTLVWPFPMRFAGRIAIGDPRDIRPGGVWHVTEVARLSSALPVDNFEGLAVVPRPDGKLTVWLISDDNQAKLQRTLLWKLAVDPAELPGYERTREKARGSLPTP
jgi:hypothetical protein